MKPNSLGATPFGAFGAARVNDAQYANDAMTFLSRELEKLDPKIIEPLSSTWWPRDMPVRTGGGFIDNVSVISVNYGTTGADEESYIGEQNNNIPSMQADFDKQAWDVFTWAEYMDVNYIQAEKFAKIARNMDEYLDKGIRLFHGKSLDKNVYTGLTRYNKTGLINSPLVHTYSVDEGANTETEWSKKTPDEILYDVNFIISYTWKASEFDVSSMANHLLIPTAQYSALVGRKVGTTGDKSILTFLYENNIGQKQGKPLVISPMPFLEGAGVGGTDRMVAYCNSIDRIRMDMTVPLMRRPTEISGLLLRTLFLSQFSEVQFLYPTSVAYGDGI